MILSVDGRQAYAYTGARAFAPGAHTLVFVHGGGLDHTVWLLQTRYLAHHGHGVLAPDLPGHGRSGGEPLSGIVEMADWVSRFMDAADVETATLIGHSMGSLVALETAARHPERAAGLIMLGGSVPMPVADALLHAAEANDHRAFDMVNVWGHGSRAQLGGNPSPGMWMMGGAIRLLERSRPGVLHNDLSACNRYDHGLDAAAGLTCPAHVVLGAEDRMTPAKSARALIRALPRVRVSTLEDCGHMMLAEKPDEVLDAILDALAWQSTER